MIRRLHTPRLSVGRIALDPVQAGHARDVLRLAEGTVVELFDDQGLVARGALEYAGPRDVLVNIRDVPPPRADEAKIVVASAVPKGPRADWMIEKLSELGVAEFLPLQTERSVVLPRGRGERWTRIAVESAKQCRRSGVMRVGELTPLDTALARFAGATIICFSTANGAVPLLRVAEESYLGHESTLFIGPEGGWTPAELARFAAAGARFAALTRTVLRTETAAVAAAAVLCARSFNSRSSAETDRSPD